MADNKPLTHPVLTPLFPRLWRLKNALFEMGVPKEVLTRPGDLKTFQQFLDCSIIASGGKDLRGRYSGKVSSQPEVVSRVRQSLQENGVRSILQGSGSASKVQDVKWSTLLERAGDSIMFYILRHCSIFVLGDDTCGLIQISGTSIIQSLSRHQVPQKPLAARKSRMNQSADESPRCQNRPKKRRDPKWKRKRKESERPEECAPPAKKRLKNLDADDDAPVSHQLANSTPSAFRNQDTSVAPDAICGSRIKDFVPHKSGSPGQGSKISGKGGKQGWGFLEDSPSQMQVPRSAIFYSLTSYSSTKLPPTHLLRHLQDRVKRGLHLYFHIFHRRKMVNGSLSGNKSQKSSLKTSGRMARLPNRRHKPIVALLKKSIDKFGRSRLHPILEKHCPLPWNEQTGEAPPNGQWPVDDLVAKCVPHQHVGKYLWSAIRHIVHQDMLGSRSNRRALREAILQFVSLNHTETMTLQQAMRGIKTSQMKWLEKATGNWCPQNLSVSHQHLLGLWIWWLFTDLVVPLLRCSFYCTESEVRKQEVLYYRKEVWGYMRQTTLMELKSRLYEPVPWDEALQILGNRKLGFAKLRMIPKKSGLRQIVQLGLPSEVLFPKLEGHSLAVIQEQMKEKYLKFQPVNQVLQNAYLVAKYEANRQHEDVMSSSTMGYDDIYSRLHPCLSQWKSFRSKGNMLKPFIISCDVSRAFDQVDVRHLNRIVNELFKSPRYEIANQSVVVPTLMGPKTLYKKRGQPFRCSPLGENSRKMQTACSSRSNTVGVGMGTAKPYTRESAKLMIMEHISNCLVQIDDEWYRQKCGIPQGSIVSTLLCNLFLADFEARRIKPVLEAVDKSTGERVMKQHVMARLVDDFLCITLSAGHAKHVLAQLYSSNSGCDVNPAKARMSFGARIHDRVIPSNVIKAEDGSKFIPWCGLLLNICNLDLQADYYRYEGVHIRSTLSIPLWKKPGSGMLARLCMNVGIKCHPLLLDTTINSPTTVRLNVYQMLLLCAMKFKTYVSSLPLFPRPAIILSCIRKITNYFVHLMKSRMKRAQRVVSGSITLQTCSVAHVHWLAKYAFIWVLKSKQQYKEVVKVLTSRMKTAHNRRMASQLCAVVDEQKSSVFKRIKY